METDHGAAPSPTICPQDQNLNRSMKHEPITAPSLDDDFCPQKALQALAQEAQKCPRAREKYGYVLLLWIDAGLLETNRPIRTLSDGRTEETSPNNFFI